MSHVCAAFGIRNFKSKCLQCFCTVRIGTISLDRKIILGAGFLAADEQSSRRLIEVGIVACCRYLIRELLECHVFFNRNIRRDITFGICSVLLDTLADLKDRITQVIPEFFKCGVICNLARSLLKLGTGKVTCCCKLVDLKRLGSVNGI